MNLKKCLGICIMTSVHQNPSIRKYWSANLGNDIIKNTMTVNMFEKIKQFLHFSNNQNMIPVNQPGHDHLYRIRVRLILETLKKRFQSVPLEETLSVDEQLCATKANYYLKQYIPMKPHKWDYKLFIMSGVSGFAYNLEIYNGQKNDPFLRLDNEPDIGLSSKVVVRLARIIPLNLNYKLYYDNYYTSIPSMIYFKKIGIHSVGPVRRNRLKNALLPSDKTMLAKERGEIDECLAVVKKNKIGATM